MLFVAVAVALQAIERKSCISVNIAQFGGVGKGQNFRAMVVSFRPSSSNRYSSDVPLVTKSQVLQRFKFKDLEAATGGFDKENLIGRANHGQIYRGVLKDGRVVAVKRPILGRLWKGDDAFENEIQILTKLFSRRLVNLLGYSCDGKVRLLVVEYMENGTLHEKLHGGGGGEAAKLSWALRVNLALQTAKAIRALHASSPPIIHRNVKASNIYIDRHWCARLGDFGLARCLQSLSVSSGTSDECPRKSSASLLSSIPEMVDSSSHLCQTPSRPWSGVEDWIGGENAELGTDQATADISPKNDVFSFGMLLLELITGSTPVSMGDDFAPLSLLDWTLPLIKQGSALTICDPQISAPESTAALKHMAQVAARCVRPLPSRRPSMDEVVQSLTKVSKLIPLPFWSGSSRKQQQMGSETTLTLRRITHLLKLPFNLWTRIFKLKKKKAFIAGLGRFIGRKLKQMMRSRSRTRPVSSSSSHNTRPLGFGYSRASLKAPAGGARVSDDEGMMNPPDQAGAYDLHDHQIATARLVVQQGTGQVRQRAYHPAAGASLPPPPPLASLSCSNNHKPIKFQSNFTRQYFTRMHSASNFEDRT